MPDVERAGEGSLDAGTVYVADDAGAQDVASDNKVVLEAAGQKLELTTAAYNGTVDGAGTYLDSADIGGLGGKPATMRLYQWRDRSKKVLSAAGFLVWAPLVIGVVLAVFGVLFLRSSSPTDRAKVADEAKKVQAWLLDPPADAPPSPTARIALVNQCMDGLAGRKIPPNVKIPGVVCEAADPSFFENKDNAGTITTIAGVVTALLALIASFTKFRFGESP